MNLHQMLSSCCFVFDFILFYDLFLLIMILVVRILICIGDRFCILGARVLDVL